MALTKKQEDFVAEIIKGATKLDAYRSAYNATGMSDNACNREAWVLMENPKVAQRIKELQDKAQKQTLVTVELITQMYMNSYKKAVEAKQHAASVAAATGLAKLHGLIIDKKEVSGELKHKHATELSESDLLNIAAGGRAGTAAPQAGERESDRVHPLHS